MKKAALNLQEYLESGVLELYALNLLNAAEKSAVDETIARYPLLKTELQNIEQQLEQNALSAAIRPSPKLKNTILNTLANLEKEGEMKLGSLPLINRFSDYRKWQQLVQEFVLEQPNESPFQKVLKHTDEVLQLFVQSATDFEAELHDDLHESFLILSGKCKCTVGTHTFFMEAGDFAEMPLHEMHSVEVLSPYVTAILQRVAISS